MTGYIDEMPPTTALNNKKDVWKYVCDLRGVIDWQIKEIERLRAVISKAKVRP